MPGDYATRLSAGEIDNLVAYLSTLRERDLTITSHEPVDRRRHLRPLGERGRRAAELADVLGQLPGTHYSALRQITPRTSAASGGLGVSHAWRSVLEATPLVVDGVMYTTTARRRWSRSTRGPAGRSGDTGGRRRSRIRTRSTRSTAASRSRQPAVRRHARRGAGGARRAEPDCRSGKRRSPTRCTATASRARRSS